MTNIEASKTALTAKVCTYIEKAVAAYNDGKDRSHTIFLNKARKAWDNDFGPYISNYDFDGFLDDYITVINNK